MIPLKKLEIKHSDQSITAVDFGIPNNQAEMDEMFRLRFNIYDKNKYIDPKKYRIDLEKDENDLENRCTYFIAKCNGKIISTIRIIKDDILPTEKSFFFEEPSEIKKIDRDMRAELGRFIIIPATDCGVKTCLPRGIIMLLMFNVLSEYGIKNNIKGGYCFIKRKLEKKMAKRKFPFHKVQNYQLKIDESDVLYNYFASEDDPVVPIYYFTEEFFKHTKKILSNKLIFKNKEDSIILKNNICTRFLQRLKVI